MLKSLRLVHIPLAAAAFAATASPCLAQSPLVVSSTNKFAWNENCGWLNFNGSSTLNVRLSPTFLSGFVWAENIGWINLGNGTPANGLSYANANGADFGVNRNATTNALSGYAWGENVGWVNFSGGALASPANFARYDPASRRLRGYAWGENIGWVNLDASTFVGIRCSADFNDNGSVSVPDIFDFLNAWFAIDSSADFNGSGSVSVPDIFDFLTAWFAGC